MPVAQRDEENNNSIEEDEGFNEGDVAEKLGNRRAPATQIVQRGRFEVHASERSDAVVPQTKSIPPPDYTPEADFFCF